VRNPGLSRGICSARSRADEPHTVAVSRRATSVRIGSDKLTVECMTVCDVETFWGGTLD
jgi:hypothetical protein